MRRWIVDGMNVIGSRPTGWWRDRPGAMRGLVEELDRFAEETGEPVTVVFDGKPSTCERAVPDGKPSTCEREVPASMRCPLEGESVDVIFASRRGRNAADDDIAAMVKRDSEPGELSVVTSDGDLAARVRAVGAAVVGAGEFRRRLENL